MRNSFTQREDPMTLPNRHLAGQVTHTTRRISQRQFLLKNDKDGEVKNAIGYSIGVSANRHKQVIHGALAMSNHIHICQSDLSGKRSKFTQDFHQLIAKCINHRHQRREALWASGRPGDQVQMGTDATIETLRYIWANPVKANLVERTEHWDHFMIAPKHWGKTLRFERPSYFRTKEEGGKLPDFVEFTPMPPPGFEHLPLEETIALFEKWIAEGELKYLIERRKKNKKVMGMARVYKLNPFSTPRKTVKMYARRSLFKSTVEGGLKLAMQALRAFQREYKRRLEAFRKGSRARFPAGTIRLRNLGVKCVPVGRGDPHLPVFEPYCE